MIRVLRMTTEFSVAQVPFTTLNTILGGRHYVCFPYGGKLAEVHSFSRSEFEQRKAYWRGHGVFHEHLDGVVIANPDLSVEDGSVYHEASGIKYHYSGLERRWINNKGVTVFFTLSLSTTYAYWTETTFDPRRNNVWSSHEVVRCETEFRNGRVMYRQSGQSGNYSTISRDCASVEEAEAVHRLQVSIGLTTMPPVKKWGSWWACETVKFPSLSNTDIEKMINKFIIPRIPIAAEDPTGFLVRECVKGQSRFSGNTLAYLSDLPDIGNTIRTALNLVQNFDDPKAYASMWLSYRFTDRLTISDTKDLHKAIKSELKRISSSSGRVTSRASTTIVAQTPYGEATVTHHARLVCDSDSHNDLCTKVKKLMDWDVWPTLENTWDRIPFSFVVDWFLDLGSILETIDAQIYTQYLRTCLFEHSIKTELSVDALPAPLHGDLVLTRYIRTGNRALPEFGILEGWDPGLPSLTNLVDGAALLIQSR